MRESCCCCQVKDINSRIILVYFEHQKVSLMKNTNSEPLSWTYKGLMKVFVSPHPLLPASSSSCDSVSRIINSDAVPC